MFERQVVRAAILLICILPIAACDDFQPAKGRAAAPPKPLAAAVAPPAAPPGSSPAAVVANPAPGTRAAESPPPAAMSPRAQAIEAAAFPTAPSAAVPSDLLIKVEVLLDRAHFSPGVIDGRPGRNLTNALAAFEAARGLPGNGAVDAAAVAALAGADTDPVVQDYVITDSDETGPFLGVVPTTLTGLSKLTAAGYADPQQELAERFHMSRALLMALNPNANFAAAGTAIVVTRPGSGDLPAPVIRVEVDKATNQVRAFDRGGKTLAVYPATVGSTERPAPSGEWAVKSVTANPNYTYNPSKLTFGRSSQGVLTVPPGPNNPVGSTWIALTKETYGIHGAPDPTRIGKAASHGCVRLTNWDAASLGRAVTKGAPVVFVGETTKS